MRKLIGMLALLLCALGGSAVIAGNEPAPTYVMRHLDTPAGERDPDLTEQGRKGAQAALAWFKGKPLAAIYVSDFKRTRQTAGPLAAERGIALTLYDPRDTPALIARVKAEKGPVLIVGHSNTVPDIVQQLGGERPADLTHPDFGDVWAIAGGKTVRERLEY
jgi:broad specificity phosphatase PhoE